MELALALGIADASWSSELTHLLPLVEPADVWMLGARDADILRAEGVPSLGDSIELADGIHLAAHSEGIVGLACASLPDPWWFHLDLDVLSTDALPAVDYPQRGGLGWEELATVATTALMAQPCGWDVTIYNPDLEFPSGSTRGGSSPSSRPSSNASSNASNGVDRAVAPVAVLIRTDFREGPRPPASSPPPSPGRRRAPRARCRRGGASARPLSAARTSTVVPRCPPSSARRGSLATTSLGRRWRARSAPYGTMAVRTSTRPRNEAGSGSSRSPTSAWDLVPLRTCNGHRVKVGGHHRGPRTRRAQDHPHGTAAGAQVDGDSGSRQQFDRPPCQRLGLRARHEHPAVDPDTQAAEADPAGDPGEWLPAQSAFDQVLDGPDALAGCPSSASASAPGATKPPLTKVRRRKRVPRPSALSRAITPGRSQLGMVGPELTECNRKESSMELEASYPVVVTDKLIECRDFYTRWFGFRVVFEATWFVYLT